MSCRNGRFLASIAPEEERRRLESMALREPEQGKGAESSEAEGRGGKGKVERITYSVRLVAIPALPAR